MVNENGNDAEMPNQNTCIFLAIILCSLKNDTLKNTHLKVKNDLF